MDKVLAARLDANSEHYDAKLYGDICKASQDYVQSGSNTLAYYVPDFDASNDLVQIYAPVTKKEFETLDRGSARNFIHPMAATEITTLSTFVSQILFGQQSSRRVEARQDGDEKAAKALNYLLQFNDDQQPTYAQGYLWCWDAMTFNRGVMYERWQPLYDVKVVPVEDWDITGEPEPVLKKDGTPRMRNGEPVTQYPKYIRFRKERVEVGGYTHLDLVSPYDYICDPMFPAIRMQEGRFAGHRVMIPWTELRRRSELPPEDPQYVLPETVARLKRRKQSTNLDLVQGRTPNQTSNSRSFYERQRRTIPQGAAGAAGAVNKDDGGVVECWALIVREKPSTWNLFDDEELELIEILTAGPNELLSCNVQTNAHDQFPYALGEARPNAHHQFGPSWALVVKPIQDHVDYLNARHRESLARTSGNIFVANPAWVDFEAFTDPNKDGLIIPLTAECPQNTPLDQIIKQIPVTDTTAKFNEEMQGWISQAEVATGAHAYVQGETEDPSQTATQFAGTQQMATGRISTLARLLSTTALCPQTRRIASNIQQFMPDSQIVRVTGDDEKYDPDEPQNSTMEVQRTDIQIQFDVVPHDGSLPGTDARKVAALSRILEAASNPAFAQYFDPTVPGSFDGRKILFESARAAGMDTRNFLVTTEQAQKNLLQKMQASGMPIMPGQPAGAPPAPPMEGMPPGTPMPSAAELPATPSAAAPPPGPTTV